MTLIHYRVCARIGVSVKTLQRWMEGRYILSHTDQPRVYTDEHYTDSAARRIPDRTLLSTCVSQVRRKSRPGEPTAGLEQFCIARGLTVTQVVSEVGGGLNSHGPNSSRGGPVVTNRVAVLVIAGRSYLLGES